MRPQIVIVVPAIAYGLRGGFFSGFGIMLLVPLLEISIF